LDARSGDAVTEDLSRFVKEKQISFDFAGTDIPVGKRIPPLRCASVGMTTLLGQAYLAGRMADTP
jgi:hypothetical protein